jgi:hypothetical protein
MRRSAVLLVLLGMFGAGLNAGTKLTIQPTVAPFESPVASKVVLTFNLLVEENGEPATLGAAADVSVTIAEYRDAETGIEIPSVAGIWHLPEGFSGGQRRLEAVVFGTPPSERLLAKMALTATSDTTGTQEVPFEVQVHGAFPERRAFVDFCLTRDKGQVSRGWSADPGLSPAVSVHLYRDFESVRGFGVIGTRSANADELPGLIHFFVTEVVDEEEAPATAIRVAGLQLTALDADGSGLAELVRATFRLEAQKPVDLANYTKREFRLYAGRTDLDDASDILLAKVSIKAREKWSNAKFRLDNLEQHVAFERRQSVALGNPQVQLYLNGELLPPEVQALAVIEMLHGGEPDNQTGLHELAWDVRVDWQKLRQRVEVKVGDTFRVDMWFPGSAAGEAVGRISVEDEVLDPDG